VVFESEVAGNQNDERLRQAEQMSYESTEDD
jgi:hypothetical protein